MILSWRCHIGCFCSSLKFLSLLFYPQKMFSCAFLILFLLVSNLVDKLLVFLWQQNFESKTSLVFTQLNQPMSLCSNKSPNLASVGSEVITLDKNRWMQQLSELAEEHFPDYKKIFSSSLSLCFRKFHDV